MHVKLWCLSRLLIRQLIIEYSHPLTHSRNLFPLPWERARERVTSQRLVCRVSENAQYLVAESIGLLLLRASLNIRNIRPSENQVSDGLISICAQSARRSDSWIRHLYVEQGTHIALAAGQMSDSRIRPTRMALPNCFYFVSLFFRFGISWLKACRPSEALVFEWIIDSAINYWIFTSSYPQQKPVPSPVGEG